jgi:hypothetical protein
MSCEKCGCVAIRECDIYELTPLISDTKIFERRSCIIDAHEINLKGAMGADCYKALCTEIKEADQVLEDLPEAWKSIVEERSFKLMLAWWIHYHWLSNYGGSQTALNGETEFDTSNQDGGKTVDSKKFAMKLATAKSKAEYYTEEWKKEVDLDFCKPASTCKPCCDEKDLDLQMMQKV